MVGSHYSTCDLQIYRYTNKPDLDIGSFWFRRLAVPVLLGSAVADEALNCSTRPINSDLFLFSGKRGPYLQRSGKLGALTHPSFAGFAADRKRNLDQYD